MATWYTAITTKTEFTSRLKLLPELVIVRGVLNGRFGPQSLPTVMDEFQEIFVVNAREKWSALVRRCGRSRFTLRASLAHTSSNDTAIVQHHRRVN